MWVVTWEEAEAEAELEKTWNVTWDCECSPSGDSGVGAHSPQAGRD